MESPDVIKRMSDAEAGALPGMLGRIAGAMLARQGWYGYTSHPTGQRVLIVSTDRPVSPFVLRALARELPGKVLGR